jgi:hypothetical protein
MDETKKKFKYYITLKKSVILALNTFFASGHRPTRTAE